MVAVTGAPALRPRTASGAALTVTRNALASSTLTSGAPGAAKEPGSTKRRVTTPAKGARTSAYEAVAASSAAMALALATAAVARARPVSAWSSCALVAALSA